MSESDFLFAVTQLAIALIAFTNIVVALRQMGGGNLSEFQLLIVKLFSVCGFCAMFFALLPVLLSFFGVPSDWIWRICNPLLALAVAQIHRWYFRDRRLVAPGRPLNLTNYVNIGVMTIAVLLLLCGTLGVAFEGSIAPYAVTLIGLLLASATAFLQTLRDFLVSPS